MPFVSRGVERHKASQSTMQYFFDFMKIQTSGEGCSSIRYPNCFCAFWTMGRSESEASSRDKDEESVGTEDVPEASPSDVCVVCVVFCECVGLPIGVCR